jgi:hypothetical protein
VRRALEDGPLAAWVAVHRALDPAFDAEDFAWYGTRAIGRDGTPDVLPSVAARERFGLHHRSPDARWVLDPFYGMDVDSTGRPAFDAHTGISIYEVKSGDRVFHDTCDCQFTATQWLDARTFVLAGSIGEWWDPARLFIDAIWVGDVETGRIALYLGAPFSWLDRERRGAALGRLQRSLYPRVRWEG